ncbi:kinase-like protein [Stipitochalara longipes BDJ]|nr:kinase-like protein [Stipitochalara longipes BDJ]
MHSKNISNGVVFDEGQGYFLVKALTHGQKAQSYITRSLEDGQLYARKKLIADYLNLVPHSDIKFAELVHPTIAPQLMDSTQYTHVKDALYFRFCNGGDLRQVIDLYTKKGETVPEDFIWYWLKTAYSHIASLHYPVDYREVVDPLIHRDIWQGNFFLDWPNSIPEPAPFPQILLGDFGSAQYVSDGDVGRGPTGVGNDIYSIAFVLLVLLLGKPLAFARNNVQQDEVWGLIPALYSDEMKSVAAELTRKLIALGEEMLQRFTEGGKAASDLRWTIPEVSNLPLFFDDAASLDEWCRKNNEARPLTGKWHLVPVQKDTLHILRRSNRLNRGQYQRATKRAQEDEGKEGRQTKRLRKD